ncbi:hypothetical protein [uncultured Flavobacterium sp.]|uniref:hypothetical protein n=1 Tax=uncultured Flavobacterium sp. TaxID=165435 RepID=UPI0030EE6A0A
MNQEEKIYQKIKNASNKAEETSFPGMDKVWNRVEEKLDTKIIKKKSEVWKKLAIAASFLLFFTVGIQLFTTQKELTKPIEPKLNIESTTEQIQENIETKIEVKKTESNKPLPEVETFANSNNVQTNTNKPKAIVFESYDNVPAIVKKETKSSVAAKTSFAAEEISDDIQIMSQKEAIEKGYLNSASSKSNDFLSNRTIYAARSSNFKYDVVKSKKSEIEEKVVKPQTKSDDLVLINGELSSKKREDLSLSEMDEMVELKNPIYIINGEEFSEESLFGESPTSKYAPLNAQKIDSIKVYLPEEAKPIYGKKGNNGVVIITIKN